MLMHNDNFDIEVNSLKAKLQFLLSATFKKIGRLFAYVALL